MLKLFPRSRSRDCPLLASLWRQRPANVKGPSRTPISCSMSMLRGQILPLQSLPRMFSPDTGTDNRSADPNSWVVPKCSLAFPPSLQQAPHTNKAPLCGLRVSCPCCPAHSHQPLPLLLHSIPLRWRPFMGGAVPAARAGDRGRDLLLGSRPLLTKSIIHPTNRDVRTGASSSALVESQRHRNQAAGSLFANLDKYPNEVYLYRCMVR